MKSQQIQDGDSLQEESDDSKDSGRLSQDETPLPMEQTTTMMTEHSDNALTFSKQSDINQEEDVEHVNCMPSEAGGESEVLGRRLSTGDCGGAEEDQEESCLLGIDCNEQSTVGLVLRIYADTKIHLDGDG